MTADSPKSGQAARIAGAVAALLLFIVLACYIFSKQNYGQLQSNGNSTHLNSDQRILERPAKHLTQDQ